MHYSMQKMPEETKSEPYNLLQYYTIFTSKFYTFNHLNLIHVKLNVSLHYTIRMEDIKFQKTDDGFIVYATGEIDLSNSQGLRKTILAALKTNQKVLVDLSGVSYIDSSGIASLVEGLQFSKSKNKTFILTNPSKQVKAIMELARLDKVFTIV